MSKILEDDRKKMIDDLEGLSYRGDTTQKPYILSGKETFINLFDLVCESFYSLEAEYLAEEEIERVRSELNLVTPYSVIKAMK